MGRWPGTRLELQRHKPALVSAFDFGSGLALAFLVIVQRLLGICTKASRQLGAPVLVPPIPIPRPIPIPHHRHLGLMPIVGTVAVASANHHQHYAEGSRAKIWPQVIKLPGSPNLPTSQPGFPTITPPLTIHSSNKFLSLCLNFARRKFAYRRFSVVALDASGGVLKGGARVRGNHAFRGGPKSIGRLVRQALSRHRAVLIERPVMATA